LAMLAKNYSARSKFYHKTLGVCGNRHKFKRITRCRRLTDSGILGLRF
jgi:hypothetical protein